MSVGRYKVTKSFRGPKQGSNPLMFKEFKEGLMFDGQEDPENKPPLVRDNEGFIIPMEYTEYVVDKSTPVATGLSDQISQKIEEIKSKDLVKTIMKKSTYSMNGAMWGAGLGLIIGLYYKKPVLMCMVSGAVGGGLIGAFIVNKKN